MSPDIKPHEVPTQVANLPVPTAPATANDDIWRKRKKTIDDMISKWEQEEEPRIKVRRELRENRRNVKEMRAAKEILADETFIADHTIGSNIKREKAPYVSYLEQSRRVLIFKPEKIDPQALGIEDNIRKMELTFTRGMRYNRWKLPWYRIIDSGLLHGGTTIEVTFDPSKPMYCAIEFVRREDMIFALGSKNLQANEFLARRYEFFAGEYERIAISKKFKLPEVKKVLDRQQEDRLKLFKLYRIMFKVADIVHVAWYSQDNNDTWLKDPMPLDLGIYDFPEGAGESVGFDPAQMQALAEQYKAGLAFYPVFYLKYEEIEDDELVKAQGIASRDMYVQEAISNLFTGLVNGIKRASQLYPTTKPSPTGETPTNQVIGPIKHGELLDRHVDFFQMTYPNSPAILSTVQAIATRNLQQAGQVDFAALTRVDTEKTATEINSAKEQAQGLTSINISLFSTTIQEVYTLCWEIARSQALIGNVYLCPPAEMKLLTLNYVLTAAGDVEVIERAEKTQRLMEIWGEIKDTPAAPKYFEIMLQYAFPDESDDILKALHSEDAKSDMLTKLIGVLQNIPINDLPPDQQAQLGAIVAAAQSLVARPGQQGAAQPPPSEEGQPPEPGDVVGAQFDRNS